MDGMGVALNQDLFGHPLFVMAAEAKILNWMLALFGRYLP